MNKIYILLTIIVAAVVGIFYYSNQSFNSPRSETAVAATIFPIYDIAKNIAGNNMDVELLLPPGASPHTFEPTPQQVQDLQGVRTFFTIGDLDEWAHDIIDTIAGAEDVHLADFVNVRKFEEEGEHHEEEDEHDHGSVDPHYWLDPANAALIAKTISDTLIEIDPENRDDYLANLQKYEAQLVELNGFISQRLANVRENPFITMHDAWGYFEEAFDLTIAGAFEQSPGREPTPQELAQLTELVEENEVRVIFTEPQLSTQSIEPIARDLGLTIEILDPIGGEGERNSYIDMMKFNAEQISKSL